MSVNLLEMIQGQLGGEIMKKASSFLGESEANTTKAMGTALPAILGGVIQKGSTSDGASGLLSMLTSGNHDGSIFSNLGSMLGGGDATSGLLSSGGSILSGLLGNKLGSVVDLISSFSGIGKKSSSSLLSMAAPMVMGMLGKHVMGKGLNASGLMSFLSSQAGFVKDAAPSGLSSIMGLANLGGDMKEMGSKVMDTAASAAEAGGSGIGNILKWGLPILLIIAVLYFWNNRSQVTEAVSSAGEAVGEAASTVADAAGDAAGVVAEAASDAAGAAGEVVGDAAGAVADAASAAAAKALEGINFVAGSIGDEFSKFLASGAEGEQTFKFNNLTFDTGSANISESSNTEVDNLAAVLKAYPNISIQIDGHTDNTGDAAKNKTLSQQRADAVKARLVNQGISADRISTMGHGDTQPVASNDSDEGKKQNRRIEVKINKK